MRNTNQNLENIQHGYGLPYVYHVYCGQFHPTQGFTTGFARWFAAIVLSFYYFVFKHFWGGSSLATWAARGHRFNALIWPAAL